MQFHEHDSYQKELSSVCKKQKQLTVAITDGLAKVKKLLKIHFDPLDPQVAIPPGKLHRVSGFEIWELWKVEVVLTGTALRPNQWPRMWFAVSGDQIVLLCIYSHAQDYDNNSVDATAIDRASDYF
ncbi:hypothetical protein COY17_03395 [Candidatus Saccharibacteria bacterium CG_4_10_14_0_2_um_filter_52_9]|nr:MAG: hypothetical protein COY17_03395 [Candidatus Saccharibacteria bacterium CG_4_10_14_0_2_um_filter_52_9]